MNYYYDIVLNFEENYWMFYEWDVDDTLEHIKKIPIFHVDDKAYEDFFSKKVKVKTDFLKSIENKTKLKTNNVLEYTCLISDGKNALALEFNKEGYVINKSCLMLEDELNINEFMYNINLSNIDYEIISNDLIRKDTRQEEKVKRVIKLEIMNVYKEKNYSKLKYIYLEWFNNLLTNEEEMYQNMLAKLNDKLTDKEYNIYNLIKLSYNNV